MKVFAGEICGAGELVEVGADSEILGVVSRAGQGGAGGSLDAAGACASAGEDRRGRLGDSVNADAAAGGRLGEGGEGAARICCYSAVNCRLRARAGAASISCGSTADHGSDRCAAGAGWQCPIATPSRSRSLYCRHISILLACITNTSLIEDPAPNAGHHICVSSGTAHLTEEGRIGCQAGIVSDFCVTPALIPVSEERIRVVPSRTFGQTRICRHVLPVCVGMRCEKIALTAATQHACYEIPLAEISTPVEVNGRCCSRRIACRLCAIVCPKRVTED